MFTGIFTALVTPFKDDGSVDHDAYRALIDAQLAAGVHGLVPCGTTGETATLTPEEHLAVVKTCVDEVKGRVPVIAGAGSNNTRVAVDLNRAVAELGVDASLQVTPWYNKPTQAGLYAHFMEVAQSAPLDVVLYNVPGRTGIDLLPETVCRLARDASNIVAIKEATGSIARAQDLLCRLHDERPNFSILSGEDAFILGLLGIGGHGVVSVISHVCAKQLVDMHTAFLERDLPRAQHLSRRVSPLQPALFFRANPIPVKSALHMMGTIPSARVRSPLVALDDDELAQLKSALAEGGWL